jgi:hypothetical protein
MRALYALAFLTTLTLSLSYGQESRNPGPKRLPYSPLDARIAGIDIKDAILRDGLSELSLKNVDGLHLGFEEIIRVRIQDTPRNDSPHFSLHLKDKSVREILDTLCVFDKRYTWSEDGASVDVYPKATTRDPSYLPNLVIDHIAIDGIPDPDQALTPLSKIFPGQQIGYFGPGLGDNTYPEPWTTVLEKVTVRQFINRIAEHMGTQTSWVWQGGRDERMFTFLKGGFHTNHP